jgi:hypothetical protein
MKKYLILLLMSGFASADHLSVEGDQGADYEGPERQEIEIISVTETPPVGSDHPLAVKVRNNSSSYLDRVAIECTITDDRGHRVFEKITFRSAPLFSVGIEWPPILIAEMGIPPGAEAEIGLYTDNKRWMRGEGAYRYDCHMDSVGGRD